MTRQAEKEIMDSAIILGIDPMIKILIHVYKSRSRTEVTSLKIPNKLSRDKIFKTIQPLLKAGLITRVKQKYVMYPNQKINCDYWFLALIKFSQYNTVLLSKPPQEYLEA